ncbi:MAG: tetratricopeptide repeat protein [Leptospirillia bacterium]
MTRGVLALAVALTLLTGCASSARKEEREKESGYHYKMGMAHLEDQNLQGALVEFRNARKITPKDVKVLFALGHTLFLIGETEAARETMERLLKLKPRHGEAINYLGNIYEREGRTADAIAAFKRASELESYLTPHFALHNLGRLYLNQGDRALAETYFQAALRRVPEYYPARADLAKMYLDGEEWDRAVDEWRRFVDLVPQVKEGNYFLGRAYLGRGNRAFAREALNRFVTEVDPENPLVPEARALLDELGVSP